MTWWPMKLSEWSQEPIWIEVDLAEVMSDLDPGWSSWVPAPRSEAAS